MNKMIWKLLQWTFILLCGPLMVVVAGNDEIHDRQVRVPSQVLSDLPASITNHNDSHISKDPFFAVNVPEMNCNVDYDCLAYNNLICSEGQCSCRPPSCWVYQYEVTGFFGAKNIFTCGECGVLGSSCNATIECDFPGECRSDGFCHCHSGENYGGTCVYSNIGWSNTLALTAMGILIFFLICIFAVSCVKTRPWRNPNAWRCMCCSDGGETHRRRGSCEKSPAFTIQAHYASQVRLSGCRKG
ncbi:uncharacterized protein LOC135106963 isoform X3 [Scylla paramamosain]|uniref:uncharacterized protein LOC135106963 isoform X3 n=1 Tax=Scylla paramamosain TaxID=85552 RepID=UPI003083EDB5